MMLFDRPAYDGCGAVDPSADFVGLISFVMKHSQKYFSGQQEYLGNVNGQVEEVYSGHNVIKAFNKEDDDP